MSNVLLIASWMTPLLLAPFMLMRHRRWLPIVAAIPAMLTVLLVPTDQTFSLSWLLLGSHFGIDEIAKWLLFASAIAWCMASLYAMGVKTSLSFYIFFLMAMSGNFLLILANDMVTFYLGFALMGLSASGLIASNFAQKNKKVVSLYLKWTIAGEVVLFSAIVLLAGHSGNLKFEAINLQDIDDYILILIVLGFGIKIALPGLHLWLPSTYASLPIAGAAVFSGPMINAGLLGLIRFLSPGDSPQLVIGQILIVMGGVGVIYGVVFGLVQSRAVFALAYSSISKMGVLASVLGVAMIYPVHAQMLILALVLYAVHHLLIKSALFLAIGLLEQGIARIWLITGSLLLCMALAGFPFTSGALAKSELVQAMSDDMPLFVTGLSIAAIFSLLLIGRIFYLFLAIKPEASVHNRAGIIAWTILVAIIICSPIFIMQQGSLLSGLLPLLSTTAFIFLISYYKPKFITRWVGSVPPGDMLYPVSFIIKNMVYAMSSVLALYVLRLKKFSNSNYEKILNYSINSLSNLASHSLSWRSAGIVWLVIAVLVFMVLMIGVNVI